MGYAEVTKAKSKSSIWEQRFSDEGAVSDSYDKGKGKGKSSYPDMPNKGWPGKGAHYAPGLPVWKGGKGRTNPGRRAESRGASPGR